MVGGFGFVEQELGEYSVIREVHNGIPFGNVAIAEGVDGVDVFKRGKLVYAGTLLQRRRRRCQ